MYLSVRLRCRSLGGASPNIMHALLIIFSTNSSTEFKEIRKEWKARKKAEEQERKQRDDQARESGQGQSDGQAGHDGQPVNYSTGPGRHLPPLSYQPGQYAQAPQATMGGEFSNNYVTAPGIPSAYNPASPYAQSQQQVYGQGEVSGLSRSFSVHNLTT